MTASASADRSRLWLWLLLLLAAVALGVGAWAWRTYDPFVTERPTVRAAKGLIETARKRPLSAEEFGDAVALLDSGEPIAQLSVIAVLQLEAERDPARRDAAVAALQRCQESAEPGVRTAAAAAATRLSAKPKD